MRLGILLSRVPFPLEKGDKLRAFHQIKELSKRHEIYLFALNAGEIHPEAIQKLSPYCKEIQVFKLSKIGLLFNILKELVSGKLPLQNAYFLNKKAKRQCLHFFHEKKVEHIYCQLIRVSEYVRELKEIPKTLDYMDALSRGMERRIEKVPFYLKPFVKLETVRLKKYEHFVFPDFDHKTIISEQDRDLIIHANNDEIQIIRNGVDTNFFSPQKIEKKYDIVFTGNMSYPPNVDGACFLVEQIMPLVWKVKPTLKVAIVGASPSQKVQKLANDKVSVSGWVDDIRSYYASSKIFIAPMQIGTGLQNKLLEAMAMEIPCLTSTLANNALRAKHEEQVLIAEKPSDYKDCILRILEDDDFTQEIVKNASKFVKANYDWEATTKQLEKLFLTPKQRHERT